MYWFFLIPCRSTWYDSRTVETNVIQLIDQGGKSEPVVPNHTVKSVMKRLLTDAVEDTYPGWYPQYFDDWHWNNVSCVTVDNKCMRNKTAWMQHTCLKYSAFNQPTRAAAQLPAMHSCAHTCTHSSAFTWHFPYLPACMNPCAPAPACHVLLCQERCAYVLPA